MNMTYRDLTDFQVVATDRELGKVKDVYFDDTTWHVRYLVVDTRKWLLGRKVLVSPEAVTRLDGDTKQLFVSLSQAEVESSPSIDEHLPVSRQYEEALSQHFGWPQYWVPTGQVILPVATFEDKPGAEQDAAMRHTAQAIWEERSRREDRNLRSSVEIVGYKVLTSDDDLFIVDDLVFDPERDWQTEQIVVSSAKWLHSKQIYLPTFLVAEINCADKTLKINIPADRIADAPEIATPYSETSQRAIERYYLQNWHDDDARLSGSREDRMTS